MTITDGIWQAIQASVSTLPHKVEWYEPSEMRKVEAGQSAHLNIEMIRTFVVPRGVVDLMGGAGALLARCQELADACKCDFSKPTTAPNIQKPSVGRRLFRGTLKD